MYSPDENGGRPNTAPDSSSHDAEPDISVAALYRQSVEQYRQFMQHVERDASERSQLADEMHSLRLAILGNDRSISEVAELFRKAFPHGDIHAHREFHQAQMEAQRAQAEFWRALRLDIAKKGLWGVLVVLVGLMVAGASVWWEKVKSGG